jgi:hypothetical protein
LFIITHPGAGAAISQLSYVLSIDYSAKSSVNFWLIDAFLAKQEKVNSLTNCRIIIFAAFIY